MSLIINSGFSIAGTMRSASRCSRIAGRRCRRRGKWWSWRWWSRSILGPMSSRRARSLWTWTCWGWPQVGRTGRGGSLRTLRMPQGSMPRNTFCARITCGWLSFIRRCNDRHARWLLLSLMMVSLNKLLVVGVFWVIDGETVSYVDEQ